MTVKPFLTIDKSGTAWRTFGLGLCGFVLLGLLFCGTSGVWSQPASRFQASHSVVSPVPPAVPRAAGLSHDPIEISSDSDFNAAHGVVQGIGSADDPYVIANWTIYGQPAAAAICIWGNTAPFVIRNCTIIGGAWGYQTSGAEAYGIRLEDFANGTIEHNYFTSPGRVNYDIYINGGTDCKVWENTFFQSGGGVCLIYGTTRTEVTRNFFEGNNGGIVLTDCWGANLISYNTLVNCGGQIALNMASGPTRVLDNYCFTNASCTQTPGAGVHVYESNHTVVQGNNCSLLLHGIEALFSYNTSITGNTCQENTDYGVRLQDCVLTEVSGNFLTRNRLGCIQVTGGSQNNVHDNTCDPGAIPGISWAMLLISGALGTWISRRRKRH